VGRLGDTTRLNVTKVREIRREFTHRIAELEPEFVIELGLRLAHSGVTRFFVYELIQHHKKALRSLQPAQLEALGDRNNTWGTVDAFACFVSGPCWREGMASDALIRRWARSHDRWWRRTAVVSTVPLNNKARGGAGDSPRTLMICEMVIGDRDEMVIKALSWALRELSKRDPDAVRRFMTQHSETLAPRVTREVNNKLRTGLKNPRTKATRRYKPIGS
jgi:3-methyladenine DNA glycosylase AlkD